jgi:hypothetical protein
MKGTLKRASIALLLVGVVMGTSTCIMENRTMDLVVTNEACGTINVNETSESTEFLWTDVFLADQINQALEDNDLKSEEIVTVRVMSASYGVTAFTHPYPVSHDWTISGEITVERVDIADGPGTLLAYASRSVEGALGKSYPAALDTAGVGIVNRALDDYLDGVTPPPVLRIRMNYTSVDPTPTGPDPIVFDWQTCLKMHIVAQKKMDFPDPF